MATRLIIPPATLPVTLTEAKAHLNVDFIDDDALISSLMSAATDYAQNFTGRVFIEQTWELILDEFHAEIKIPYPPLMSVLSIRYYDAAGIDSTLAAENYTVDAISQPGWIVPSSAGWPNTLEAINTVRIQFKAGYDLGVPDSIRSAIFMMIGTLYANRETVIVGQGASVIPWSAEQLLRPYRIYTAIA